MKQTHSSLFGATIRRRDLLRLALVGLPCVGAAGILAGCGGGGLPGEPIAESDLTATPWPEMDALFRSDSRWLGGDGVYSVDLGGGRVLWLFGDSFVSENDSRDRRRARLVRNSVALQTGYDPASASLRFYRGAAENGTPESYFPAGTGYWLWPGHGVRLPSGALLLFLLKVRDTGAGGSWAFETFGTQVLRVADPDADPSLWARRPDDLARNPFGVVLASASALIDGDFLYAYGARQGDSRVAYVARWPLNEAEAGRMGDPEWHVGGGAWQRQSRMSGAPAPVFGEAQSEFTVHRDMLRGDFLEFQVAGFGATELAYRRSNALSNGWSGLQRFHRPPESDRPGATVYQGKAHPMLRGADVPLSYSTGHDDFDVLLDDLTLGYPRFLRGTWRGGAGG